MEKRQQEAIKGFLATTLVLIVVVQLYSCGGGGGDSDESSQEQVTTNNPSNSGGQSGDNTPSTTPDETGKDTLAGVDADGDGIRDDVQRYLANTYGDNPKLHNIFKEVAKNAQQRLIFHKDKQETIRLFNEYVDATKCLWSLFPSIPEEARAEAALAKKIHNTNERIKAHFASDTLLDGEVFEIEMERYCD